MLTVRAKAIMVLQEGGGSETREVQNLIDS